MSAPSYVEFKSEFNRLNGREVDDSVVEFYYREQYGEEVQDIESVNTGLGGDVVDVAQQAAYAVAGDMAQGVTLGSSNVVSDYLHEQADAQNETIRPESLQAMQDTGFNDDLSIKDGSSITGGLLLGAGALGSMIPSVIAGGGAGRGLAAITKATSKLGKAASSAAGYGATGGTMMGGGTSNQIKEEILNADPSDVFRSEGFLPIYEAVTKSQPDLSQEARLKASVELFADQAGQAKFGEGFALGAASMGLTGPLFDKVLRGVAANGRLANALVGSVSEAGQEFIEGGGQQYIANDAIRATIDPTLDPMKGVISAGATGAAIGGGVGGGIGALTGRRAKPKDEKKSEEIQAEEAQPRPKTLEETTAQMDGATIEGVSLEINLSKQEQLKAKIQARQAQAQADAGQSTNVPTYDMPAPNSTAPIEQARAELTGDESNKALDSAGLGRIEFDSAELDNQLRAKVQARRMGWRIQAQADAGQNSNTTGFNAESVPSEKQARLDAIKQERELAAAELERQDSEKINNQIKKAVAALQKEADYAELEYQNAISEMQPAYTIAQAKKIAVRARRKLEAQITARVVAEVGAPIKNDQLSNQLQALGLNAETAPELAANTTLEPTITPAPIPEAGLGNNVANLEVNTPVTGTSNEGVSAETGEVAAQARDGKQPQTRAPLTYNEGAASLARELTVGGGVSYTTDENGNVAGRTASVNPEWYKDNSFSVMNVKGDDVLSKSPSVKVIHKAVADYESGKVLSKSQQRIMEALSEMSMDEQIDDQLEFIQDKDASTIDETLESLMDDGILTEDMLLTMNASEVDAAAREYYENREGKNGSAQEVSSVSTEGQDSSNQEKTGAATQEESLLADYSQGDLDSKQAQEQAQAAENEAKDKKAQIDADADNFTLTGSDRAADTNPAQADVFSASPKKLQSKTEKQAAEAKNGKPLGDIITTYVNPDTGATLTAAEMVSEIDGRLDLLHELKGCIG